LPSRNEVVVLTGIPGSGKSTFAGKRFPTYKRINLDTLKTRGKEDVTILLALEKGENVIVDNTNTTRRSRKRYVDTAKAHGIPVRSVYLECSLDLALERNASRGGKERVPDRAVKFYHRILEPPSKDEGFDSIEIIRVVPDSQTMLD
jgi:predicted kinase